MKVQKLKIFSAPISPSHKYQLEFYCDRFYDLSGGEMGKLDGLGRDVALTEDFCGRLVLG